MQTTVLLVLAALLVILGIAGTVLPLLPGIALGFGGLFLAAWAEDFARVGALALTIIGALGVLGLVVDFFASLLGAKRAGASPQALVGATIGAIVGLFLGIPGLILGPFVGAVAGEFLAKRELLQAGKVGVGTWIGLVVAAVAKVVIAFLMVATFLAFYLANSLQAGGSFERVRDTAIMMPMPATMTHAIAT
jgi:uncharacterized protein YqgC (DUF456 family)